MNRLAAETSPYLLQHAHNPVDWYAWKPEALERAQREQKPILVSIGYSTCHWCHVMERESFENEEIARLMNEHFVCIKVDREERPDVDAIYMEACQLLTGSGGWPLNCFLTPDARPFYAGTYYPPRPAHNRPSWRQVLEYLARIWQEEPDKVWGQAERLTGHIAKADDLMLSAKPSEAESRLPNEGLHNAFYALRERFDRVEGGFGAPPKFPSTMAIDWLLRYHHYTGAQEALDHALFSLEKMCAGGIYDHLGGGFSRYSTDREWLAPHFEKMLYDNALLVSVLSDAYRVLPEGDPRRADFRGAVEETLTWLEREMTHPNGGFYAAQDADSEGVEGKFFVWERSEIERVLGEEARIFCAFYDVTTAGNWEGHNILRRLTSFENFASEWEMKTESLCARLALCRDKLFAVREKRVHPGTDTKIVVSWNALMASACFAAGQAFNKEEYRQRGRRNLDFLLKECLSAAGQPALHVWTTEHPAFLEDYAYLIAALLDCYETFFVENYLHDAVQLLERAIDDFYDPESALFFFTRKGQTDIVLRKRDLYDNATPSGNSTMLHNLQRVSRIFDRSDWRDLAEKMLTVMQASAERYPQAFARWGSAAINHAFPPVEVAIVGENALEKAKELQFFYFPNKIFCGGNNSSSELPLLKGKRGGGEALIYVCQNFTCQAPVDSTAAALRILQTH